MATEISARTSPSGSMRCKPLRRLIVNADDFGCTGEINAAVQQAHREGILTTASLMVNERGFREAVEIARSNPRLGVGLHLTLLCGHSALSPTEIPSLANHSGGFSDNPLRSGLRFFFQQSLQEQLRREIHAQFDKFHNTGLELDHVNGHLHLHLHPMILQILLEDAEALGIRRVRLTSDPLRLNLSLEKEKLPSRLTHAAIFGLLCRHARPLLARKGIKSSDRVFGLLQNGRVNHDYITALLPRLPIGDSELYSHPSLNEFRHELDALTHPTVLDLVNMLGIQLIRYQDL